MNLVLRAAAYDIMKKRTAIPIQEINKDHMEILKQNNVKLENDVNDMTTSNIPDLSSLIYITIVKVAQ